MITSIEIENLRGIRHGKLEGLAPLTILTGHNASGKSTVLDALLIAAAPSAQEAVETVRDRHPNVPRSAEWLVRIKAREAAVELGFLSGDSRRLTVSPMAAGASVFLSFGMEGPSARKVIEEMQEEAGESWQEESEDNYELPSAKREEFGKRFVDEVLPEGTVRLVDSGLPRSLNRAYSEATKEGRMRFVYDVLRQLAVSFDRLEILTDANENPSLYFVTEEGAVPVGLAGDGIQSITQLSLELAAAPGGLVLIEEPEVYQHPKALWQTARVLLETMRRDVQVVFTTHSQELIDLLLMASTPEDLGKTAHFTLALEDGKLLSDRRAGEDLAFARLVAEVDVR